ncbi:MAG: hypothetical protein OXU67_08110 [Chloroflexota bacterium]|nr:hypothetical protein [Chloroflexota bacterium]
MTRASRSSDTPRNRAEPPTSPPAKSPEVPAQRPWVSLAGERKASDTGRNLTITWSRLNEIGANDDLREMLEHVLNPGWEGVGPAEVGEIIAQAATQAAVLDYLDWYFAEPTPPGPEALPAVYRALVAAGTAVAKAPTPALAALGPDILMLLEQVLGDMQQDHPVATAVLHAHLLLATWMQATQPAPADGPDDLLSPRQRHAQQLGLAERSNTAATGPEESRSNLLYAEARRLLRKNAPDDALDRLLAGTLAALQGAPLWFGWSHEFAGTLLERPLQEGLALVALLRRVPSCPFPLLARFADEQQRWRDVVLTGRYVDFESLVQPHPDRLMRGPAVTSFMHGLANDGREFEPEDLAQGLSQLEPPAREQVWLYLYFNAGFVGPNLLGQGGAALQLAMLELADDDECWSREIAEALMDDLTYHPPAAGGIPDEGEEELAASDSAQRQSSTAAPEPGEPRVPLAVRSQAATLLAKRLLDDPTLADLLADTIRYAGDTPVGRWLTNRVAARPTL